LNGEAQPCFRVGGEIGSDENFLHEKYIYFDAAPAHISLEAPLSD